MLNNFFNVRNFILFYLFTRILISYGKPFKPGKPLSKEEFLQAAQMQVYEDGNNVITDTDTLEGDIIQNFMVKYSFSIENHLWPDGVVPYVLDEKFDEKGRILIARAFEEFQNKTCIQFVPKSGQKDFIRIMYKKGCSSSVGCVGGPQTVILGRGCYALGIIMHELMHTLGFIHEQSRMDRDDYVTVMWENIKEGREDNFKVYNWYSDRILEEKYDYFSILHYNKFAFSKDPKTKPTLIPKKKNTAIGQRKSLSAGDIRKINRAYRCSNSYEKEALL